MRVAGEKESRLSAGRLYVSRIWAGCIKADGLLKALLDRVRKSGGWKRIAAHDSDPSVLLSKRVHFPFVFHNRIARRACSTSKLGNSSASEKLTSTTGAWV